MWLCGRGPERGSASGGASRWCAWSRSPAMCRPVRKILQAATGTLKRTHLELGGKAPVLVFDDADIDAVVEGIRTFGYYNAGQDCTAACRLYAGAKVYDRLVADLSSAVKTIQMGTQDEAWRGAGSTHQRPPARPCGQLRGTRPDGRTHGSDRGWKNARGQRILLRTHGDRGCPAGRRDRAPRGVWPGGV